MLMIDEVQALGRMSYLERAIHTVAADGVSVAMIAQSVAALDALYGREGREAFESAAGVRLFIAPRDPRTAREVSAIVGKTTREAVTRNWGRTRELFGGARSHTARLEERPLLTETDARMLDPDRVVIVAGSQQPILATRVKYYEDRAFRDAVAAAKAQPLPWPEREREPQPLHEPAAPQGFDAIVTEEEDPQSSSTDARDAPSLPGSQPAAVNPVTGSGFLAGQAAADLGSPPPEEAGCESIRVELPLQTTAAKRRVG